MVIIVDAPRCSEFEQTGKRRSFPDMVTLQEADLAGTLTVGMECGVNLENGVNRIKKLHQITGSSGTW
jgi:hypothetical protein